MRDYDYGRSTSRVNQQNRNSINYMNSTTNLSRSKSPHRNFNGIKIYNFSQINSYRNIDKPNLVDKDMKNLNEKINLNKLASKRVKERIKDKNLYINYEYNPFSKNDLHHKSEHRNFSKSQKQLNNLIDAMHNKKKENIVVKQQKVIAPFHVMKKKYNELSQMSMKAIHSKSKSKSFTKLPQEPVKHVNKKSINQTYRKSKNKYIDQIKFQDEMQFDDIIQIKQQNFFSKNKQDINLFSVLFDKDYLNQHEKIFQNCRFNQSSMIDKHNKFKIFPYRDISYEARKNTKKKQNKKNTKLSEDEIENFKLYELNFQDLMNVATGKVTSQALYKKLQYQATINDPKQNQQLFYRQKQRNNSTNMDGQIQQIIQKQQYLQLQLNKRQKYVKKIHVAKRQQIENELECCLKLIKNNIHDKRLHHILRNGIDDKLMYFIRSLSTSKGGNGNWKRQNGKRQNVKNNMLFKDKKDRTEMIKLLQLIKTYDGKNQFNRSVNNFTGHK